MAEKGITNRQFTEAKRNAEAYFEDTKNRGKILFNAGKISKEDYYQKIRKVGIETGVISPNEFPGGAPEILEPLLEIGLGIGGYVIGAASGLRKGAPFAGGAAGYGVGAGIGQAGFDYLNKLTADEGQVVKPDNLIMQDALKQAGIDATLSYGIDKVIVPKILKPGYQLAKNVTVGAKEKALKGIQSFKNRMSPEEQKKFYEKFVGGETAKTEIGQNILKNKKQSQEIIDNNRIALESEGLTPRRYQVLAGSGTLGQILRGASDAASVIPGGSYYGKKAFQNTLDDTLASLQNPLIKGSGKNIQDRAAYVRGDAFIKDIKGDYVRNPAKLQAMEEAYENLPLQSYANLIKISDDNIARYKENYNVYEKGMEKTTNSFDIQILKDDVIQFNDLLKKVLVERDVKFSQELPPIMRKIVETKTVPKKVTGTGIIPEKTIPAKQELTGKEILEYQRELRNLRNNERVFDLKDNRLSSDKKLLHSALSRSENNTIRIIENKEPGLSGRFATANNIFKENSQFLADNEGLISFAKTLEGKSYNPYVYDGFRDDFRTLAGTEFKTILGRGLAKDVSPQKVVQDFLTTPEGIPKLKKIMIDSAKVSLKQRRNEAKRLGISFVEKNIPIQVLKTVRDKNGKITSQRLVTENVSEVQKAEQEFGELILNEMEDLFDSTLISNLRAKGSFDPASFLEKVGATAGPNSLKKKKYYKELLRQAQGVKDLSTGEGFLKDISYERLVSFGKMFKGFQDEPGVSRFLLRRAPLALSSGVTLSKVLPIAGAGAGGAVLGIPTFIATMGIINLFNKFISQPLGKSYWQSVKGDSSKLAEFLEAMYKDTVGQDAIKYQLRVSNLLRQLPRGLLVSAGQDVPADITNFADSLSEPFGVSIPQAPRAPRTREQYFNPGKEK